MLFELSRRCRRAVALKALRINELTTRGNLILVEGFDPAALGL